MTGAALDCAPAVAMDLVLVRASASGRALVQAAFADDRLTIHHAADPSALPAELLQGGRAVVLLEAGDDLERVRADLGALRALDPATPVVCLERSPEPELVVAAMRQGVADFLDLEQAPAVLRGRLLGLMGAPKNDPVVRAEATRRAYELALRVARTDVSVLITGESGTGKEVVGRFIHQRSPRRAGPFVAVNCAAIPEQMMEAMLFGHDKGAFTGAHQARAGKFEQAHGGTLLLDEISEMALDLQAKLLRVLQEREVERVGGRGPMAIDVRVLATSNRDLKAAVAAGRFREDLYYRLSVFPLQLAPLRERREDILPLAEFFLDKHARRLGGHRPRLSPASQRLLKEQPWPGNVRELENVVQRALVMAEGPLIEPRDLQLDAAAMPAPGPPPDCEVPPALADQVRQREAQAIAAALAECDGRRRDAARQLGISERTLRYKMQKLREQREQPS